MDEFKRMLPGVAETLLSVVVALAACRVDAVAAEKSGAPHAVTGPSAASKPAAPAVDLRPLLQKWGLETHCQGGRGTCSAFVVTGALEYALARQQQRGTRLSVEFLNWAANQTTKAAVDGGFFSDLWNGCAAYGVCAEANMPYLDRFDPAAKPSERALAEAKKLSARGLQLHRIKEWDPHKGLTGEQLAAVKRTLERQWPVCGGFLWPKQERWENGVLQLCPRRAVRDGHSVLLVGYRDDDKQPGGGVFLIRNTAGASRDGRLSYEYVQTYMNDAAWIGFCSGEQ